MIWHNPLRAKNTSPRVHRKRMTVCQPIVFSISLLHGRRHGGGMGGIFNPYKNFSANFRCIIRFKIHASSTVIKHHAFIIPTRGVIFEHDRGFVAETRKVSLVRLGLHLTPSLGLRAKSIKKTGGLISPARHKYRPDCVRLPWSIAQSVPIC